MLVGLGHRGVGSWLPQLLDDPEYEVLGVCDLNIARARKVAENLFSRINLKVYQTFEDVLDDRSVDAVALTVRAPDQGGLAARALLASKHVSAEVPAAHSIKDCWSIVLAAETSRKVYALAEQTRYWGFFQEWRRLVKSGELGKINYAEGQYFHYLSDDKFVDNNTGEFVAAVEALNRSDVSATWQHLMPPIHYLPHELSPLLATLDDRVEEVVGMSSGFRSNTHSNIEQPDVQVALMKTVKGTVLRLATSFVQPHPEANWHWYALYGTKGRVETGRSGRDLARMWLADRQMHDFTDVDWSYERVNAPKAAQNSGHGDADYYVHRAFADAVLRGATLDLNVYAAMDTAAPAILAADSILMGSQPLKVPDFRPSRDRPVGKPPKQDR